MNDDNKQDAETRGGEKQAAIEAKLVALREQVFADGRRMNRREWAEKYIKVYKELVDDMLDLPEPKRTELIKKAVEFREVLEGIKKESAAAAAATGGDAPPANDMVFVRKGPANAIPMNPLERAMMDVATRGTPASYNLNRALLENPEEMFWLLQQSHPEVDGVDGFIIDMSKGHPFAMEMDGEVNSVLLFSSAERAKEYIEVRKIPAQKYHPVKMAVRHAFHYLGKHGYHATLNMGCSSGSMCFPPAMMLRLSNTSLLPPDPSSGPATKES